MANDKSSAQRFNSRLLTAGITLLVVVCAAGVVAFGRAALALRDARAPTQASAPVPVMAEPTRIVQGYEVTRRFAGQFEARQESRLAFELPGTVVDVLVRGGDAVKAGDILARQDDRLIRAERDRLRAARDGLSADVELARRIDERQRALRDSGHVSAQKTDETGLSLSAKKAELAATDAALAAVEIRLEKTVLHAPFDGHIADRLVDAGVVMTGGAPVLTLLEDGPRRFSVALPNPIAAGLALGMTIDVSTDVASHPARLIEISADLDPATRSRTAIFEALSGGPPARTSGEIALTERIDSPGAWLPVTALRAGPDDSWTVLTIDERDESGIVGLEAVELLHIEQGRVFARGTFTEGQAVLGQGTHRVVPGQSVTMAGN